MTHIKKRKRKKHSQQMMKPTYHHKTASSNKYPLRTHIWKIFTYPILGMVHLYRLFISPLLPQTCIFSPSCSEYALQALKKYNTPKAIWLITKRLLKCHALFKGNTDDPVP